MTPFSELEQRYASAPISAVSPMDGHGVIKLAGRASKVQVTSSNWVGERDEETGWFDLMLEQTSGEKILIHNALSQCTEMPSMRGGTYHFTIFPNIVLLNAERLRRDGGIREISFRADGLEELFPYDLTEWQSTYGAPTEVLNSLRDLRSRNREYPRAYDRFDPHSIYLLHSFPRICRLSVAERTYSLFMGLAQRSGLHRLSIEAQAIATIRFKAPVPLDDALDAAWAWRRFFQQITMKQLPFTAISCRSRLELRQQTCALYLPNLDQPERDGGRHPQEFSPRDLTLRRWKDRTAFAAVMKKWLECDPERRMFRVRLDRALAQAEKETSTQIVAQLCGAIESIGELKQTDSIDAKDLDRMVTAAAAAGAEATPAVPQDRIRGILSLLQHRSLPQRLKALSKILEPTISKDDAAAACALVLKLRTFEAHGDHLDEMAMPMIPATIDMLASMCVLWDLTSCGMPAEADDSKLTAVRRANAFGMELAMRKSIREQVAAKVEASE